MNMKVDRSQERIVCAAIRLKDGTIILGVRHWDELMVATYMRLKIVETDLDRTRAEQGFMTNKHRFVNRQEAMQIAKAQGQIYDPKGTYDENTLYSECLY